MNTFHRFFVTGLLAGVSLVYASTTLADQMYQQQQYQPQDSQQYQQPNESERSYGSKIGKKALNGVVNLHTAPLEIPKSIISNSNAEGSNFIFGLIGGLIEGSLNTTYRAAAGIADLTTFLIPTKPIVQPQYVWDDFYETKTTYKDAFRLDDNEKPPIFALPK
jgi:putative exosortase-associated protein (TIGR04073 family)